MLLVEVWLDYVYVVFYLLMIVYGKIDRGVLLVGVEKILVFGNMMFIREFLECVWSEVIDVWEV